MDPGVAVPRTWRVGVAVTAVLAAAAVWTGAYFSRPDAFMQGYTWSTGQAAIGVLAWTWSGVALWGRAGTRRLGTLLVVIGAGIPVIRLIDSAVPALFSIGLALQWLQFPLQALALLSYPSARPGSPQDRIAVGLLTLATAWHGLVAGLFYDPALHWCGSCGPEMNLLLIRPAPTFVDGSYRVMIGTIGLVALYTMVVLLQRWASATPLARRVRGPMLLPAIVYVGIVAFFHLYELSGELGLWTLPIPLDQLGVVGWFAMVALPVTFLIGLAQARARRGRVADLVTDLHRTPSADRLEESLRQTLRDPTLEVGYWSADADGFVSADGAPVPIPVGEPGRLTTIVDRDETPLAVLVHDAALREDAMLLESTTAAVTLAVENARLASELRAQLAEVRDSRARIVAAADEARRRVERDLHDGAQQRLVSVALLLRQAWSAPDAPPVLTQALAELDSALRELRDLARGVYPMALEDGLAAALDGLAEQAAVATVVVAAPSERLPQAVEMAAYFVASEAVANAAKHANATLVQITSRVEESARVLVVEVVDDGVGGAALEPGGGLRGLQDRVEALDGILTIDSVPNAGTTVRASIPCVSS